LVAQWAAKTVEVTFDAAGGAPAPAAASAAYGATLTAPTAPTKYGHSFTGWQPVGLPGLWVFGAGGTELTAANGVIGAEGDNPAIQLVATWDGVERRLSYDVNASSAYPANPGTYLDDAVLVDAAMETLAPNSGFASPPTRAGHTFAGWFTQAVGGTKFAADTRMPDQDVTLFARWSAQRYSIDYELGGGEASGNPGAYEPTETGFALAVPTRIGHTFTGWTAVSDQTGQIRLEGSATVKDTVAAGTYGNLSLVAAWSVNSYQVVFDPAAGAPRPPAQTVAYGGKAAEPAGTEAPVRDGYVLTGWRDADTGQPWDFAADTMPAHDLELTALWELQAAPTAVGAETVIPVGGTAQLQATVTVAPGGSIKSADAVWPDPKPTWASAVGGLDTAGNAVFTAQADLPAGSYPFAVRYTDNSGQTATADFVVDIQGLPTAVGGSQVIAVDGEAVFNARATAWGATGGTIARGDVVDTEAELAARVSVTALDDGGQVAFDATGLPAGDYEFQVRFADNLGQVVTAAYRATVQAAPVVTGGPGASGPVKVGAGSVVTWELEITTSGTVTAAEVAEVPEGAEVSAALDGVVRFEAGELPEGTYEFTVRYTDDLGQSTTVELAVFVQDPPKVADVAAAVALGGHAVFEETVTTSGVITGREIVEHPKAGRAELGSVHYWADEKQHGEHSFVVEYTDDLGQTATARYTAHVQPSADTTPPPSSPPGGEGVDTLPLTGTSPPFWAAVAALTAGLTILLTVRRRRLAVDTPDGASSVTTTSV
jgi:uncharacterized repeat protein (TIGR02543 family)